MIQKIKKFLLLLIIFSLLFSPQDYTQAAVLDNLGNSIATNLGNFFANFILTISNPFLVLGTALLNWVISDSFIDWSYTNPAKNPIIEVGWTLTKDFTNMLFIIALAIIGLGTALGIKEYEYQKTLPLLIGIALLINFTPVICGVIVDGSNIIMNFFLEAVTSMDALRERSSIQFTIIKDAITSIVNPIKAAEKVLQALVLTIFNFIAAFVLILFAFLFAIRYVAIWILVILSPLAFFSYIFPALRSFWRKWWDWFIQWCIVGIVAAFFLYLSNHMIIQAPRMVEPPPPTAGLVEGIWIELLKMVLPFGIALGFQIIGMTIALQTSAIGSEFAITGAQKVRAAATQRMQRTLKSLPEKGKTWARETASPGMRERLRSWAKATPEKSRLSGLLVESSKEQEQKWYKRAPQRLGKAIARKVWTTAQAPLKTIGKLALVEKELEEVNKVKEEFKKLKDINSKQAFWADMRGGTRAQRQGAFAGAIEDGVDLDLTDDDIIKLGREAATLSSDTLLKPIIQKYPSEKIIGGIRDLPGIISEQAREEAGIATKQIIKDVTGNTERYIGIGGITGTETDEEIKVKIEQGGTELKNELASIMITAKLDKKIKDLEIKHINWEAVHRFWGGRELGAAAREFGNEFVNKFMKEAEAKEGGVNWYIERGNYEAPLYLAGNTAQDLGFRPLEGGGTRRDLRRLIADRRTPPPPPGGPGAPPTPPPTPPRLPPLEQYEPEIRILREQYNEARKSTEPADIRRSQTIRRQIISLEQKAARKRAQEFPEKGKQEKPATRTVFVPAQAPKELDLLKERIRTMKPGPERERQVQRIRRLEQTQARKQREQKEKEERALKRAERTKHREPHPDDVLRPKRRERSPSEIRELQKMLRNLDREERKAERETRKIEKERDKLMRKIEKIDISDRNASARLDELEKEKNDLRSQEEKINKRLKEIKTERRGINRELGES